MIVNLNTVRNSLVYSLCDSILHLDKSQMHDAVYNKAPEYAEESAVPAALGLPILLE
eukprot:COSAG02_NODE_260_length_26771_cov_3110.350817_14_plen_57_part_00